MTWDLSTSPAVAFALEAFRRRHGIGSIDIERVFDTDSLAIVLDGGLPIFVPSTQRYRETRDELVTRIVAALDRHLDHRDQEVLSAEHAAALAVQRDGTTLDLTD